MASTLTERVERADEVARQMLRYAQISGIEDEGICAMASLAAAGLKVDARDGIDMLEQGYGSVMSRVLGRSNVVDRAVELTENRDVDTLLGLERNYGRYHHAGTVLVIDGIDGEIGHAQTLFRRDELPRNMRRDAGSRSVLYDVNDGVVALDGDEILPYMRRYADTIGLIEPSFKAVLLFKYND